MSTSRRTARGITAMLLLAVSAIATPVPAATASETWCAAEMGGSWDVTSSTCSTSVVSNRKATMDIAITVPDELMSDPTMGPTLRDYAADFAGRWRALGTTMPRDSVTRADAILPGSSGSMRSVVFHEFWQTVGDSPNNAYQTWTFDLVSGRQMRLADLVQPGIEPLVAIPPLARPFLSDALDQARPPHLTNTYPFTTAEWEPQPNGGGFSDDYRAFAMTPECLILYLPGTPMAHPTPIPRNELVWSMDGGTTTVEVPLAALTPILRAG